MEVRGKIIIRFNVLFTLEYFAPSNKGMNIMQVFMTGIVLYVYLLVSSSKFDISHSFGSTIFHAQNFDSVRHQVHTGPLCAPSKESSRQFPEDKVADPNLGSSGKQANGAQSQWVA
jgi:hypothetical protein